MKTAISGRGINHLWPGDGRQGVVKCPEMRTQARTHWRKCWVAFFSCQCWLDSGHMPGAPAAPPGRSWVLFQSPQVLQRVTEGGMREGVKSRAATCPGVVGRAPSQIGLVPNLAETGFIQWIKRPRGHQKRPRSCREAEAQPELEPKFSSTSRG